MWMAIVQLHKVLLKHFSGMMLLIIQNLFDTLLLDYQTKEEKRFMLLNVLIEHPLHPGGHSLHRSPVTQNLRELVARIY